MKPYLNEKFVDFKRRCKVEEVEDNLIKSAWIAHKDATIAASHYILALATESFEDDFESDICFADSFILEKSVPDKQMIFGWANVAIDKDGYFPFDWEDDITLPEILEDAVYDFVLNFGYTGEEHIGDIKGYLIESVMFTKEKMAAIGIPEGVIHEGWWIGFYIPDRVIFEKVLSGQYSMFSVYGKVQRIEI